MKTFAPPYRIILCAGALGCLRPAFSEEKEKAAPKNATEQKAPAEDRIKKAYESYTPAFVTSIHNEKGALRSWLREKKVMDLSSEKKFFTLNQIQEDSRANALVLAGIEKEEAGLYREALKIYQTLFDTILNKYPNMLYRVSPYGVFVPVSQYVQRRILKFPKEDLTFYRTLHDSKAKTAFEQARRQYSLAGFSEILDTMMATSYGDNTLLELGNAALDTGHYLEAMEHFTSIRDYFPHSECVTPELSLRIAYCKKMLGLKHTPTGTKPQKSLLTSDQLSSFQKVVATAKFEKPPYHIQRASGTNVAANDYTLYPPTADPMGHAVPQWSKKVPSSRLSSIVYSHPVVSKISALYRHKNIIYCRSLLNGELRWKNDLGGRAVWQDPYEHQWPQEDVLVQDGLVFTPMYKNGPSLVALDEVTGQMKWAYGPISPSSQEEANIRFEATPAGGPRTIFAGYVLDNIEGETHTDSEYGLMAFDSTTGRIRWRTALCRMLPGKFAARDVIDRRNRIRSFCSPPLYHQGTVYYTTNAGAIAAVDGQSGRIKWLMRYPYHPGIHDATRRFGRYPGSKSPGAASRTPALWYPQRPLMIGENLYMLPVDTGFMLCMERHSGKVKWMRMRSQWIWARNTASEAGYFMGPLSSGELLFVYSGRKSNVQLVDPNNGKTLWQSPEYIMRDEHPVMKYTGWIQERGPNPIDINSQFFRTAARPFLTTDDKLYIPNHCWKGVWWWGKVPGIVNQHTEIDLKTKKVLNRRRHYGDELLSVASRYIQDLAPKYVKTLEALPHKDKKILEVLRKDKEVAADSTPVNKYGPFRPYSRITFKRFGVLFELRMSAQDLSMIYDRSAVAKALKVRTDPDAYFARAELAFTEARYDEVAELLQTCLSKISSEDLDFRAAVNQLLYRVARTLARSSIRAKKIDKELEHCLGMRRTATTVAREIESLFAITEAAERKGDWAASARGLHSIIRAYGQRGYPIPSAAAAYSKQILSTAHKVLDNGEAFVKGSMYESQLSRSLKLIKQGMPLYVSSVTPLHKNLTVRAGDLATARLINLQQRSPEFAKAFADQAVEKLEGKDLEEQLHRLWEFPATPSSQKILDSLFASAAKEQDAESRRRLWRLSDVARVCNLSVAKKYQALVHATPLTPTYKAVAGDWKPNEYDLKDEQGTAWLVMERQGNTNLDPQRLFLAGRIKKRLDNRFILRCMDLRSGKVLWEGQEQRGKRWSRELRLKDRGQEAGFFKAFVHRELVMVHGLYDVLAFNLSDGKLRWRYRVPFNFEIKNAVMSNDLLILAGETETVALYTPTDQSNGEVAWQAKEEGGIYIPPYFHGDRLVSVRKLPFNVTVRYRATGRMVGRLELPDLSLNADHPLLEEGPKAMPAAHDQHLLVVTDSWYYIALDINTLSVLWKRLIDQNDVTREPMIRFTLKGNYLAVLKEDYIDKAMYLLSSQTGDILWKTDPKNSKSPQPLHSVLIEGERLYGIGVHPGQSFYVVGHDCKTGAYLFKHEQKGYFEQPEVELKPHLYGNQLIVRVRDRQDFEINVFDTSKKGNRIHVLQSKGAQPFGVHGRVSEAVQDGRPILFGEYTLGF